MVAWYRDDAALTSGCINRAGRAARSWSATYGILALRDVAEHVAHEVPRQSRWLGAQDLGDRRLLRLVDVGDGELDALQPAADQATQELDREDGGHVLRALVRPAHAPGCP
jgi:hypothetical protein